MLVGKTNKKHNKGNTSGVKPTDLEVEFTTGPNLEQYLVDIDPDLDQDSDDISPDTEQVPEQILQDIKPQRKDKSLMVLDPVRDTTDKKNLRKDLDMK